MKVSKNTEHNSIEITFGGEKPSEEVRKVMKAYGFWWFGKGKCWCHSLDVDADFFTDFVESRIRPMIATPSADEVNAAVDAMSESEKQALLARLMGK